MFHKHSAARLLFVLAIIAAVLVPATVGGAAADHAWTGTVIQVTDGDTFDVRLDSGVVQTIRVAGINTNEITRSPKCYADEATDRLDELIMGKTVRLEADDPASSAQGRPVRHVFVGSTNIAEKMLREGYGTAFLFVDSEIDYSAAYVNAFWDAAEANRGLHREPLCGSGPSMPDIDLVTNGDASGPESENPNGEWTMIRNLSSTPFDLTGWAIRDSAVDYYDFPAGTTIAPHDYLKVHVGTGTDTQRHLYMGYTSRSIYSRADGAFLIDPDGDIRAFDYWPCRGICGDDGALDRLVITEVNYDAPGPDATNPGGEWIRIENAGPEPVDFRDWTVESWPWNVSSTTSRVLAPGDSVTINVGQGSDTASTIYMGRTAAILDNPGDNVVLYTPDGDVADCFAWKDGSCRRTPGKGHRTDDLPDFNGDGWGDLVLGAPGATVAGVADAGTISIRYGRHASFSEPANLVQVTSVRRRNFNQSGLLPGAPESGDAFGAAIGYGDLDADGYDDLVIGVPGETLGAAQQTGLVQVIYGASGTVRASRNRAVTQASLGGSNQSGDGFGSAVVVGDFNGDGYADAAIGAPGANAGAGRVSVVLGAASGIDVANPLTLEQENLTPESGDGFGSAMTVGDFNGDGYADLAVAAPGEGIGGRSGAGAVTVFSGSASGIVSSGARDLTQGAVLGGSAETGDALGTALASGDVDGDGFDDLVIGVPGEDLGARTNMGITQIIPGSAQGLDTNRRTSISQDGAISGTAETGDRLGSSLALGDLDNDGYDDLVIGVPGERLGSAPRAGMINVVYGSASGLTTEGNRGFSQAGPIAGGPERDDLFGTTIKIVDHNGDSFQDVLVGAPGEALHGKDEAGVGHLIEGSPEGLTPAGNQLLVRGGRLAGTPRSGDQLGAA